MSKEAWDAVRVHSRASGGSLALLATLAYYSYDREPPFHCTLSQATLANLLHVNTRMVERLVSRLTDPRSKDAGRGELQKTRRGRRNEYDIRLPLASALDVSRLFAPRTPARSDGYSDQIPARSDGYSEIPARSDGYSEIPARSDGYSEPQYPSPVSGVYPHDLTGIESEYPSKVVSIPVIQDGLHISNMRNHTEEKREERETPSSQPVEIAMRRTQREADPPPPPPPSVVMSAQDTWKLIQTYLDGEVSQHELDGWRRRVRSAGWSSPHTLCLRGEGSLMRYDQFKKKVRYAVSRLGIDVIVEFVAFG